MHIIGRGRYARETYPRGVSAGGAILQVGYDQVVTPNNTDIEVPPTAGMFFPRNVAADPLRVTLPNVHAGNVLEMDFRACLKKNFEYYSLNNDVQLVALVTFNGVAPVLTPSPTVFVMQDSTTGHWSPDSPADEAQQPIFNVTALVAVPIPAGAISAIVQMTISATAGFMVSGNQIGQNTQLFATLKCSELRGVSVSQAGPGSLIATG